MFCTNRKPIGKSQPKAPIVRSGLELVLPLLLAFFLLLGLGGSRAFAMPPNPIEPPPVDGGGGGGGGTFTPPDNGFAWAMTPRFGLMKDGLVDYHWDRDAARYFSDYVHPKSETVSIDGCLTAGDSEAGTGASSGYTYNWTLDGTAMANPDNSCSFSHDFDVTDSHSITRTVEL